MSAASFTVLVFIALALLTIAAIVEMMEEKGFVLKTRRISFWVSTTSFGLGINLLGIVILSTGRIFYLAVVLLAFANFVWLRDAKKWRKRLDETALT